MSENRLVKTHCMLTHIPTDSLRGGLGSFKDNRAGTFGATIRANVNISTNDIARGAEKIFEVLPSSLIRQL
jgi:hypothetical protein